MIPAVYTIFGRSYGVTQPIQAEYQAVLDRAAALGFTLPDAEQQRLDNNRIYYLKNLGIWNEFDSIYFFDKNSLYANYTRINWKNPSAIQYVGYLDSPVHPSFVSGTGWMGGGGGYWLGPTPSLHAVKALPGDVSVFYRQFGFTNAASSIWGTRNGSSNNFSQGNASCILHGASLTGTGGYTLNVNILHVKNGAIHNKYISGVLNNTSTYASGGALSTVPLALLGNNLNGTVSQFVTTSGIGHFLLGSKNLETYRVQINKIIDNTYE